MRVQIAAHNVEVTDAVRELVHERAGHLMRFFDGLSTVHVTLGAEKERRLAEFVAHVSHGAPLVSRAEGATLSAAIHEAAEKVETQIRRHKDRIRDHHERLAAPEREPAEEPSVEDARQPETDEVSEGDDIG